MSNHIIKNYFIIILSFSFIFPIMYFIILNIFSIYKEIKECHSYTYIIINTVGSVIGIFFLQIFLGLSLLGLFNGINGLIN